MKSLKLGLALGFSQFCRGQLQDCFYMDGSSASTDFPCDPDAAVSTCCGSGWRCASSLYCIRSDKSRYIGSCTDRSFQDNACPFPLTAGFSKSRFKIAHPFTITNNATICQDHTVCPDKSNTTCCNSGAGKKEIVYHYTDPIPSEVKDLSSFYALAGYSIPPTATVSTSSTSTPSPSSSTESPIKPVSASSNRSSSAKVGIGVGVGLGAPLLALLLGAAILLLRRHRKTLHPPHAASHWPEEPAEMSGWGKRPHEMNGDPAPAELGRNPAEPYEM